MDVIDALVLDLLDGLRKGPRSYEEVIEAWRTSCPRLTVWEEANRRGYLAQWCEPSLGRRVGLTDRGRGWLAQQRPGRALEPAPSERARNLSAP